MKKLQSPSGDLGAKRAQEVKKAFPRPIKRAGVGQMKGFKGHAGR